MEIIKISNLTHYYNEDLKVIDDLSMTVEKHDFLTLVGPSGCGKSTLFKVLTKLLPKYEGEININDIDLHSSNENFGYMPQKDLLLPWRTLYRNVILPLEINKKQVNEEEITELIELFGLNGFNESYPHELSGGMKQRAALLRTFLMGNDIVLLDEPFAALDGLTKKKLQLWLVEVFKELNKTVIFITHDIEEALTLSNRIIVLSQLPARIINEFKITAPYPRTYDVVNSDEMIKLKKEINNLIG
ncbi:ABC transporter ATP-binding protein [Mycoplasmatota bacterium WC44]